MNFPALFIQLLLAGLAVGVHAISAIRSVRNRWTVNYGTEPFGLFLLFVEIRCYCCKQYLMASFEICKSLALIRLELGNLLISGSYLVSMRMIQVSHRVRMLSLELDYRVGVSVLKFRHSLRVVKQVLGL